MRGLAYRRQKARNKYAKRAKQIYHTYGGFKIVGDKVVPCESIRDYFESANPYLLKTQGSFEHHSDFLEKASNRKAKSKMKAKKEMLECLHEPESNGNEQSN